MTLNKKILQSDEIDLLKIISIIFNNKLKILLITAFAVLTTFFYQNIKQTTKAKYKVITEVKINTEMNNFEYSNFNIYFEKVNKEENIIGNYNVKELNQSLLFEYFLSVIQDPSIWTKAVENFGLLKKEDYVDLESYNEAIKNFVFKVFVDRFSDEIQGGGWSIKHITDDPDKWIKFLEYFNKFASTEVINRVQNSYEKFFFLKKNLLNINIEDYDIAIENALKIYDNKTERYLAYLNEQALIARELGIKKSTLPSQNFNSETGVITYLTTDIPYYMRGWDMIEKEIYLIKNRTDKSFFVDGMIQLQKERKKLVTNKDIERLENLFKTLPIFTNSKNFKAGRIMSYASIVKNIDGTTTKLYNTLLITGIISLILSIFYVLIANELKLRKF